MALSLSHCLDAEISVSDFDRSNKAGVGSCIRAFSEQKKCDVEELNIQIDHIHLLVMIPPKLAVSDYVGMIKGRSAIRVLNKYRELRRKPYWGNHFWTKGY